MQFQSPPDDARGDQARGRELAKLVAEVYSIEIVEPLAERATADLQRLGFKNVHVLPVAVRTAEGREGFEASRDLAGLGEGESSSRRDEGR